MQEDIENKFWRAVCILTILVIVISAVSLPFIDDASITNSIICAAVALKIGVKADRLDKRMQKLEPIQHKSHSIMRLSWLFPVSSAGA